MSLINHSSDVMTNDNTFEAYARPGNSVGLSEKASVHFSLEDAGKVCNLVEPVNG
jgi:hypothetical protein